MTNRRILCASSLLMYRIVFLDPDTRKFSWKEYNDVLIAWRAYRSACTAHPEYNAIGLFDARANKISYKQIQEIRRNRIALNRARRALAHSLGRGHLPLKDLKMFFGELEAVPVPV